MLNVRLTRAILLILLVLPVVGVTGCSVFSTVGGWISQGYENTVAYFNAYYNAKRLFDEAEAEVFAAQLAAKGKSVQTGTVAAPIAVPKQKFALVIDKCSNILAFSPMSNVVDDALFLIGKSFYYQEDYVKAERKFTELVAQFPNGDLALDGELWLLKTLFRLKRFDDAVRVGQSLAEAAAATSENAIAADALATLGDIAVAQRKHDLAIEQYRKAVEQSDDAKSKAEYAIQCADLLFTLQQYDKAAAAYLEVEQYSPPAFSLYYSELQAAICYRHVENYDRTLAILAKIESDYRFIDHRGTIRLERAETLSQSGRHLDALEAYKLVDSLYQRTEVGANGAFKLGELLQYELGDYAGAKLAYERAGASGPQEQMKQAQRMSAALGRYFTLWREYDKADSILTNYDIDSMWIARDSTGAPIPVQATADPSVEKPSVSKADSATQKPDSLMQLAAAPKLPAGTVKAKEDTARTVAARESDTTKGSSPKYRMILRPDRGTIAGSRALASYQLGELFHADFDAPDSTYIWLNRAIHSELDSVRAPRALYLMAGIANADSLKRFGDPKELYRFIVSAYPKSNLAEESRVALGFPPKINTTDVARTRFFAAESLFHAGHYQSAVDSLSVLARETSDSTYLPKSLYTMGWIYEHGLKKPDSAIAQYKALAMRFGTTAYGAAAIRRIPPPPEPTAADSAKSKMGEKLDGKPTGGSASAATDSTVKASGSQVGKTPADTSLTNSLRPKVASDTTEVRSVLKKLPPDSTRKVPEFDDIRLRPAKADSSSSRRGKESTEK